MIDGSAKHNRWLSFEFQSSQVFLGTVNHVAYEGGMGCQI